MLFQFAKLRGLFSLLNRVDRVGAIVGNELFVIILVVVSLQSNLFISFYCR